MDHTNIPEHAETPEHADASGFDIRTFLAGAGVKPNEITGDVVPPIHLATTYEKEAAGDFHYTREGNPTRLALESTLAQLEGGVEARAFSSGMAAATAVVASLGQGAHVVYPDDVYVGVRRLLTRIAPRWGVASSAADFTDAEAVASAIRPETQLIWIETPSNPLLAVTDIRAIVDIAANRGARTLADNTWATPLLQLPLQLGVDLSLHSLTKYIAGHSDVLGGAVITRSENSLFDGIRDHQRIAGNVLDPFSSWLTIRGLRTLAVRMERACDNADQIASFLDSHPSVARVYYPGLPDNPGRAVAQQQMRRSGAMMSFETTGDRAKAAAIPTRTRLFVNATSLGGTESLIEHRATSEGPDSTSPETLIRISVGLEYVHDLIEDLDQAL